MDKLSLILRYGILLLFVAGMILTGILSRKKIKTANDFMLGGGRLGGWFSAFAYGTTYFSAVVFIGYGGSVSWKFGLSSVWIGIGNAVIGTLLAWLLLGRRTYRGMEKYQSKTMPEYFGKRFSSPLLKYLASIIIFVFLVPYSASVYSGLGILFDRAFGIDSGTVILIMGLLTAVYLVLGGYLAAAANDFIQGLIMLAGIITVTCLIIFNPSVGGFSGAMQELGQQSADAGVQLNSLLAFSPELIALIIMTSLGTWGLPQMAHKFHAIKDEASIKKATVISTAFALVIAVGSYLIGTFGRVYMNGVMPVDANGTPNGDLVVPRILEQVLTPLGAMGDILFGVIAVMVLSASMSTLSSIVLSSGSSFTMDLLGSAMPKKLGGKKTVMVLRGICVLLIIISVAIALKKFDAIVNLMSYSWGAVSGAFIGPFVYGIWWKGMNKYGVYASFFCGITITMLGITGLLGGISAPMTGAAAIICSLIVSPAVSAIAGRITNKGNAEIVPETQAEIISETQAEIAPEAK